MRARQGRLKAEYSDWYPRITPGVWHNAAWLAEIVLQQQRRGTIRWALEERPLSERHFDFQGESRWRGNPSPVRRARDRPLTRKALG
jgi:hypothetical protein